MRCFLACLVLGLPLVGCDKKAGDSPDSSTKSNGFGLKVSLESDNWSHWPWLNVEVTGKCARLGVLVTDPTGKVHSHICTEEQMLDNSEIVRHNIGCAGTYTIVVKTFRPESVVARKVVDISPPKVRVEAIRLESRPWHNTGKHQVTKMDLTVLNEGDFPIIFPELELDIGPNLGTSRLPVEVKKLDGSQHVISWTDLWFRPKAGQEERGPDLYGRPGQGLPDLSGTFRPGTYELKGKMRLGGANEPIIFANTVKIPP
ncbi:MAG TPA: hypothetical protein DCX07_06975 [Phycisphaerales bacterium]|nr:hypothetical protein [Phycisphaerales bacterium]